MESDALIYLNHEMGTIEIVIGGSQFYLEWAEGEGADIGWYRRNEDKAIVGCCIPFDGESVTVRGLGGSVTIDSQKKLRERTEQIARSVYGDDFKST